MEMHVWFSPSPNLPQTLLGGFIVVIPFSYYYIQSESLTTIYNVRLLHSTGKDGRADGWTAFKLQRRRRRRSILLAGAITIDLIPRRLLFFSALLLAHQILSFLFRRTEERKKERKKESEREFAAIIIVMSNRKKKLFLNLLKQLQPCGLLD